MKPLVSVITPTANRPEMLKRCIEMLLAQDYEYKEIVIVGNMRTIPPRLVAHYDPKTTAIRYISANNDEFTIGNKRNFGCENAHGKIIVHMDDDDHYSPQWISKSVEALQKTGHKGHKVALTGLNKAYFHNQAEGKAYLWDNSRGQPYVCEATMCYWKETWQKFKFPDVNSGEGASFCANAGYIQPHEHINDFVAMLHGGNTASHKELHRMKPISESVVNEVLNGWKVSV